MKEEFEKMQEIEALAGQLYDKDNKKAYKALQLLLEASRKSNVVYPFFDQFAEMLEAENSYLRNRGIALIAANARWDTENKTDEVIDRSLKHITDVKPITARQCIKALPELAEAKPELAESIVEALKQAQTGRYADSMRPLIEKDIEAALKQINSRKL